MKLKFKQIDEEHIKIIAYELLDNKEEEREVGEIFTPSGSGHTNKNSIQICGFSEAFDLWGCANFREPVVEECLGIDYEKNKLGKKLYKQCKDIQLMFGEETERKQIEDLEGCLKCFSSPCRCENKTKYDNPYAVKRQQDLHIQKENT